MQELTIQGPTTGKLNQCGAAQGIPASDSPLAPYRWSSVRMQTEAVSKDTSRLA